MLPSEARTGAKRDSVVEALNSPKEKNKSDLLFPPQAAASISRSTTPDLIPDPMSSRIGVVDLGEAVSAPEDVPFERMGSRVEPSQA